MSSPNFFDNQPLRYYKGHPVYLAYILAGALAVGALVVLILQAARFPVEFLLSFWPAMFLRGLIWQPLTYVFVNELSFFTPLAILCFARWGVEIEQFLGRRRFLAICAVLLIAPVLYSSFFHLFGREEPVTGVYILICGLLIAYAAIYPNLEYFGWFPLKWFAAICVACGSLTYFATHNWVGLGMLWMDCLLGYGCVQFYRGHISLPNFAFPSFRRKPKFHVVRAEPDPYGSAIRPQHDSVNDIDPLLDKIARNGLASLTEEEKARLQRASQELKKHS